MNGFNQKQQKRLRTDLIILFSVNVLFWLLLGEIELFEKLYHFSRTHEEYQLDELIPLMSMLMLSFMFFSFRRWRDTKKYGLLIEQQSNKDLLTGLYNRRLLECKISSEFSRFERYKQTFCILILDIDNFKLLNASRGRIYGDNVLKEIAFRLLDNTRTVDTCCRWGGEEFLILCPATNLSQVLIMAEKLRLTIQEPMSDGEVVTASFGAMEMKPSIRLEDIVNIADVALYQAKSKGKNCISVA